jgi:rhamnopyranosyl-N-acetylglucosaminyl-diphospho-decaprenol beta-1,3/1,4-galactofuranosyltransferase
MKMNNQTRPGIAAVVVTYNRKTLVADCLTALLSQTQPVAEIFVVDNGSDDGTTEMLRESYQGSVNHIRNEKNVGSSAAFAQGLRSAYEAGHEWFWMMDDDCLPRPDSLRKLHEAAVRRPDALYGPIVLEPETGRPVWHRPPERMPADGIVAVPGLSFNGILVCRRVVANIGFPMSALFISGDDAEYSLRARAKGYQAFIVGESIIHHPLPPYVRRGRVGKHYFVVYPRFRSPDRAYYYFRNWAFVIRRYWAQGPKVSLLRAIRDMACLALSGTVPRRTWTRALRDGWMMGAPQ